jgi:NhaA family Na+:H+ antiporter
MTGASERVAMGAWLGLVVGKPIGVLIACRLALWLGAGQLPTGITWRHLTVLGLVAAKVGVLAASGCAAIMALVLGRVLLPAAAVPGAAETVDDAEGSTVH